MDIVDTLDTADIVYTVDTLDNVKSVNSVDDVSSVNSVHKFQANSMRTSHAKWQVGNSCGNPLDPDNPDNPDNPPDLVSGGAVPDPTSSRAGGQDDGRLHELPQTKCTTWITVQGPDR